MILACQIPRFDRRIESLIITDRIQPECLLILDSSLISEPPDRDDVELGTIEDELTRTMVQNKKEDFLPLNLDALRWGHQNVA